MKSTFKIFFWASTFVFVPAIVIDKPIGPFVGTMYNVKKYPAEFCTFIIRLVQVQHQCNSHPYEYERSS